MTECCKVTLTHSKYSLLYLYSAYDMMAEVAVRCATVAKHCASANPRILRFLLHTFCVLLLVGDGVLVLCDARAGRSARRSGCHDVLAGAVRVAHHTPCHRRARTNSWQVFNVSPLHTFIWRVSYLETHCRNGKYGTRSSLSADILWWPVVPRWQQFIDFCTYLYCVFKYFEVV